MLIITGHLRQVGLYTQHLYKFSPNWTVQLITKHIINTTHLKTTYSYYFGTNKTVFIPQHRFFPIKHTLKYNIYIYIGTIAQIGLQMQK